MIMNTAKYPRRKSLLSRTVTPFMFALLCIVWQPAVTHAQGQWTTNGNDISNTNTGNVGIGTSTPATALHVPERGIQIGTSGTAGNNFHFVSDLNTGPRGLRLYNGNYGSGTLLFTVASGGNFGIGTGSPGGKLVVKGAGTGSTAPGQFTIQGDTGQSMFMDFRDSTDGLSRRFIADPNKDFYLQTYTGGVFRNDLFVAGTTGSVGIGTTAPAGPLHVQMVGGVAGWDKVILNATSEWGDGVNLKYATIGSGGAAGIMLSNPHVTWRDNRSTVRMGRVGGVVGGAVWDAGLLTGDAWGVARNNGLANPFMLINSGGNVGIGTTAPTAKLHVAGDVVVDGVINAKYQDVAEWVETTQQLSAGTVVVLDTERSNHVLAATEAYDTKVAGVVSAQPGLLLGEAGADKVKVATTGRVKIKVDATKGAIKVGDLLVTSGEAGVAMKSEPLLLGNTPIHRPGTLIGKALEPLASGKGEILVLLSLQ